MERQQNALHYAHSLLLLPVLAALLQAGEFTQRFQTGADAAYLGVFALYFLGVTLQAGRVQQAGWAGYLLLGTIVGGALLGLTATFLTLVVGIALGTLLYQRFFPDERESYRPLLEFLSRLTILGNALLCLTLLQSALGEAGTASAPAFIRFALPLFVAGVAAFWVTQLLGKFLMRLPWREVGRTVRHNALTEGMLLLSAPVIVYLLQGRHSTPLLLAIALVWLLQAMRSRQATNTSATLAQRLHEMSVVNNLTQAVTSHITRDEVLLSIYEQVYRSYQPSSFYIGVYRREDRRIEYPLAMRHNERVEMDSRDVRDSLCKTIVDTRKTLWLNQGQPATYETFDIDLHLLPDPVYIGLPLVVGELVIGVMGLGYEQLPADFGQQDVDLLESIAGQVSLAVRNATLYDHTVLLAQNLSLINQSLSDVMFNMDSPDAPQAACTIAMTITDAQRAAIYLLRGTDMHLETAVGFQEGSALETFSFQPRRYGREQRVVEDVQASRDAELRLQAAHSPFTTCIFVALMSGNTIIGHLVIYHDQHHFYDAPEVNLLEMLANQITAALENSSLLNALEQYATEQAQLFTLSQISSADLDMERIVRGILQDFPQMIEATSSEIAIYDRQTRTFTVYVPDGLYRLSEDEIPEFWALMNNPALNLMHIYYVDQDDISAAMRNFLQQRQAATGIVLPMWIGEQALGVLLLLDETERLLTDNENRLLEMAINQIAAQLHNARMYRLTEEELVERLGQLELIEESAQQISTLEPESVIQNVLVAALQATRADFAALSLATPAQDAVAEVVWRSAETGVTTSVPGSDLLNGNPALHNILKGDTQELPLLQLSRLVQPEQSDQYESVLQVPLRTGAHILGILNIESREEEFFSPEHMRFVHSLAGHAAVSISNARLLEERQRQIKTLSALRTMSLESLREVRVTRTRIAGHILHTALHLLGGHEGALYSYESASSSLRFLAGGVLNGDDLQEATPEVPLPLLHQMLHTIRMAPTNNEAHYAHYEAHDGTAQGLLVIPIRRRKTIREVLCITFAGQRHFVPQDWDSIHLLAAQAAGHLENARLNEQVYTNNERMRTILNNTRDGILLLDTHGTIQTYNAAAEEFLGYIPRALQDLEARPSLPAPLQALAQQYRRNPDALSGHEYEFMRGDTLYEIKTLISPLCDSEGEVLGRLLVLRDIHEEKELQRFQEMLQHGVVHDLGGPLGSIITSLTYLLSILDEEEDLEAQRELLEQMISIPLESAQDLLRTVETLRDIPRIPEMQLEQIPVHAHDLAAKAHNALNSSLNDANITLHYDMQPDLPLLYVDLDLARRIVTNLLHNAVKFTPENGAIMISADVWQEEEGFVRVRVSDTGPGIPPEERERIFKRFIQISGHRPRTGGKGTGLGLNFCKVAAEAHGGRIWVADEGPLPGACFAFTLPIAPPDAERPAPAPDGAG